MRFRKRKKNDYSLMIITFMGHCIIHLAHDNNALLALKSKV